MNVYHITAKHLLRTSQNLLTTKTRLTVFAHMFTHSDLKPRTTLGVQSSVLGVKVPHLLEIR